MLLVRYGRAVARRWLLVGLLAVLGGAVTWGVARFGMKPVYRASCVMLLSTEKSGPLSPLLTGAASLLFPGMFQSGAGQPQTMAILRSRKLAGMVVRRLGLVQEYGAESERDAINRLLHDTRFDAGSDGQVFVTAEAPTARLAAEIPNAYHRALEEYRKSDDASLAQRNLRFVERQLWRTQKELQVAEERLKAFQEQQGVVVPDTSTQALVSRQAQVEVEQITNQIALKESTRRLQALRALLVARARSEGAPAVANTAEVERLRSKLAELEAELQLSLSAYTEEHPQVRALRQSIDIVKEQLREHVRKSVAAAEEGVLPDLIDEEVKVIVGQVRDEALRKELARLDARVRRLPKTLLDHTRLLREVRVKDTLYQNLLQEYHKAKMVAAQEVPPVRLLDPAEEPTEPCRPQPTRMAILGAFAGMVAGILLSVLAELCRGVRKLATMVEGVERIER